ncbi:MAG TPA: nucleotidyltransferase domain-containing protein [Trebonia sp.]|nr:nucleotidyltransferase domain-containing protein [Trebonia sp.]
MDEAEMVMIPDLSGCLAELRRKELIPADHQAVFLVGSVARGWTHAKSDLDIYIVSDGEHDVTGSRTVGVPLVPGTIRTLAFDGDDRRFEVTYWLDAQVDQMLAKVSQEVLDSNKSSLQPLVITEERFLERLSTCLPLLGDDWVQRRRKEIEDSAYSAFTAARSLAYADTKVEDAIGMLASGDLPSAVLAARLGLGQTVDALLDSRGVYGTSVPKWRARRVQDAALDVLSFARYWQLETMATFDPERPREWIEEVIAFCRDLSMEVEL